MQKCQCFRLGQLRRPSPMRCESTRRSNSSTFTAATWATRAWRLGRRRTSQRRWGVSHFTAYWTQRVTPQNLLSFLMPRPSPTPSVPTRRSEASTCATTRSATRALRFGHHKGPWLGCVEQWDSAGRRNPVSCTATVCSVHHIVGLGFLQHVVVFFHVTS